MCALVVTYNRRDLLRESLTALSSQSTPPAHVLVVDSASTDGTPDMVRAEFPDVEVLTLERNEGGAGGFHHGLRHARGGDFEWIWLMDDDTVATPGALEALLRGAAAANGTRPEILASRVEWTDGSLHRMNAPRVRVGEPGAVTTVESLLGAARDNLLPIRTASFVSILIRRDAVQRHGLPIRGYFLWNDDAEYTARLLKDGTGYLVGDSVVQHKTPKAYVPFEVAGERFYYEVRNKLFMMRTDSWELGEKVVLLRHLVHNTRVYLKGNGFSSEAVRTVARGLRDGLGRRPTD